MVKLLDLLEEYVSNAGYQYSKLVGATSADERARLIEEFNQPNSPIFIFLLSTRAGPVLPHLLSLSPLWCSSRGLDS